ncbi:MAG: glycosyltransferase family 39 protein [Candidatus Melainabacteria bacterium]|nr:glycosyltransferase family 39 protein [Candidatus Melainabacteria bacterium]
MSQKVLVQQSVLWQVLPVSLIFIVACGVFFAQLGLPPLFNPDEGLYAEPGREMLETGEYLTTLLNYDVRFTKPPLVIWAMAFCYKIFGVNEFAARFFGASCGAILAACTYLMLERYRGVTCGVVGTLALITAPLYVATGRMAITDMPLALFVAGSLFAFYRAFREQDAFWRWIGYVLLGLAVMTKGPIGLVLPVLVLGVYHGLRGNWREALKFYKPLAGVLIVALISVPWFVAEIIVTKGAYFQAFIVRENLERFTSVVDSHKGPWWYHLAAMLGGFFPWAVFVPQSLINAFRVGGTTVKRMPNIGALLGRFQTMDCRQDFVFFAALWSMITLTFFSLSVSKLLTYTLPAFPALAVVVGSEVGDAVTRGRFKRLFVPLILLGIICSFTALAAPLIVSKLRDAPMDLYAIVNGYALLETVVVVLSLGLMLSRRYTWAVAVFVFLTLCSSAYYGAQAVTSLSNRWEGPIPSFARFASISGYPIFVFGMRKPGVPFYTCRKVRYPADFDGLCSELSKLKNAYVLTRDTQTAFFATLPGCRIVSRQGQFMLVECKRCRH